MGDSVNYMGTMVHRNAPLDFLAVTDHAEYLGVLIGELTPKGPLQTPRIIRCLQVLILIQVRYCTTRWAQVL